MDTYICLLYPRLLCLSLTFRLLTRFGGTDGQYHYNDIWQFDPQVRKWQELRCVGILPSPREGHAATRVGDVMYIFGGRGVDGKEIAQLGAFKIPGAPPFCLLPCVNNLNLRRTMLVLF